MACQKVKKIIYSIDTVIGRTESMEKLMMEKEKKLH